MNILETKDLCYSYSDGKLSLNNVNILIEKGKTTAILGGNGAGKSTLFLNLNGILKPGSGEILFNGKNIEYTRKGILEIRKRIGIVFQDPEDQLFSSSVIGDISFGLMNIGLNKEEIRKRVDTIISQMGINDIKGKPTHELSFGQKKKVAIAGILVMEPDVIILDEPTAGLDPRGVSEMLKLLKNIKKEKGITLIISTHEMDIVPTFCDNAYVLDRGEVVYSGDVKSLMANADILRKHGLRLPRMAHLMEILKHKDNLDVNTLASTISGARETINDLVKSIKEDGSSDFNKYIYKNNKKLRMGYTTGSCAAAATKAATIMLISGKKLENISIITPKGIKLNLNIHDIDINKDFVSCGVKKDSGDDPDVTNGLLIYAKVSISGKTGINISGGEGVGRITKRGLECSVGEAAINKVPRSMIEYEVKSIIDECEYKFGVDVEIYVPGGEEIAKRTFNKRLGIIGGISILGTSGIVEPMSEKALIDSFKLEMRILYEEGFRYIILTPGNYGQTFVRDNYNIDEKYIVKTSNFIGEALDYAKELNFKGILIIGHMGKFIKLAGGIMNTHSKYADCRMEIIAANAALEGAGIDVINNIMQCITTDEAIEWLDSIDIRQKVMNRVINKIDFYINNRVYESVNLGAVMFSNIYGVLCSTNKCLEIIKQIKKQEN